ncbi:RNA-binding domain-containing protein [Lentinus tigrinus ALCF2SS1-7]|uniref:RNA-binding domain-containing protein n=1 Tax=Lentinus tigrinus ALCF2SS1-7 TaxID=1328758 RepID=UPI001165F92E|nr:RNA-binding domain-containing protein [Lentinus tigrinus ALCF2SS1-7]
MSRLIVKNLPAYLTQERLRKHFESSDGPGGTLTDVKLVLKPDGTSRRFGFIGYKSSQEAERAKKWFNRSFVDSSRITVDVIDGAKDAPAPRPNKRPRLGPSPDEVDGTSHASSKTTKKSKPSGSKKGGGNELEDQFLQVMQPSSKKGPSWKDDDPALVASTPIAVSHKKSKKSKKGGDNVDAVEEGESTPQQEHETSVSDMDWLRHHTTTQLDAAGDEKVFEQSEDEAMEEDEEEDVKDASEPPDPTKATILQTARLFVRNLAFSCTEDELRELFQPHGDISQVHLVVDPNTKQPKGLAYVSFVKPEAAFAAYDALDKTSFQGRLLHILPAVDRKGRVEEVDAEGKKRSLKQDREVKRKAAAGKEFNWAMLYMNSDAVVSSIADRMNVSKADILNPESDNAAVKLALAETHVIQETKTFLEQHGVDLSALDTSGPRRPPRSDRIILVKNIPYGTSADDVRALFEAHGELRRVLVPPAGTLAVVEFVNPDEGRKAFRAVAYRRLGNSIIYLEKGPEGMFITDEPITDAPAATSEPVTATAAALVVVPDSVAGGTDEPPLSAGTTLFVKNLSFSTTPEKLTQVVRHLPEFAFARIQTKPDPARPGARLSMGYGFVGFRTPDGARRGMKSMDGMVLDGHKLVVKWAGRGAEEGESAQDKEKVKARTTKMIVKNVPFEATKKDIRELFGSHAQLKSVRLPRKFDHRTRGFAFLEFTTRHEAERAYATLRHTHFLGRHLVLEWAEEGDVDVDKLREKAGVSYGGGAEMPGRKRKLELGDGDGEGDDDV